VAIKVAIIGDYPADSSQIRGGVQAAFVYLVRGLSRIGDLQLHVITLAGREGTGQGPQEGVTVHRLPPLPRFERARNHRTFRSLVNTRLAEIRPDVVHAESADVHAFVALHTGFPTVVTAHGIRREDTRHYASLGRRLRGYFDSLVTERYVMRRVRHLIAINRYITDYFAANLRPDARIYRVPNAVDEAFFDLARETQGNTTLYVGRVTRLKRVLDLVRAFQPLARQRPALQLRIAGECSSEPHYVGELQSYIAQQNLQENVHVLGPLGEPRVLEEYACCDLLVLASAQESLPMVIAQAMAAGKPVVASRVGGIPEMVRDGENGFLVEVGKLQQLSERMLALLDDPALRTRMGHAGRERALKEYHPETVGRRTYEVYQRVLAASLTAPRQSAGQRDLGSIKSGIK
jgi:glycosyltransferase involved in cell wall biosynthesis